MSQGALGDVLEAELHYDMASPRWMMDVTKKEYTPGEGILFGLGTSD